MKNKNYKKIINELIKRNFPKLRKRIIFINKGRIFNIGYSAITFYFILFFWIIVHPKAEKYSKEALKALFVHELAHLAMIANMNLFQKIKFAFKWTFTKKGKRNFERDADVLTIKKGYGEGLLRLVLKLEKTSGKEKLKKRESKGYLNSKQIKFYLKRYNQ